MSKLFKNLEKFKDKIALIGPDEKEYSYNDVLSKIKSINLIIKNRSLVLIIASNNVVSIMGYISFIRSNHVSILLDKSFKSEYAKKIIKKYKPNYIFCPIGYLGEIEKKYNVFTFQDYNLIKTNFKKHHKINKQNLLLLSTSGTTQNPKFVRLSDKNLLDNTRNIVEYLNIESNHTTITTMPMGYSYGLSIINTHLETGSKIIVNNNSIFERKFWKKLKKYRVTSFGGVPQFYEQLRKVKFENFNFPSLKYFTQAGGKLDENSLNYFGQICKRQNKKFIVMYGQAEAGPRMSYLEWNKFYNKIGSIGKPLRGSKFKIISDTGRQIKKPFFVGELIYFGKNVSLGYAKNLKDLRKGDINKGKLFTGDLAYIDNDNYYFIRGRKNRISKIFGIRIDLDDIEKELKKNSYKVKCVPDNQYLKILIMRNYNIETIRKIIQRYYGINKNFIHILKIDKFVNTNYFKEIKN